MARMHIYVPDQLKTRMDAAGDGINWSELARPVFLAALADHEHRKEQTMDSAIERLRASKEKYTAEQEAAGKADGRKWAANHAEYEELRAICLTPVELRATDSRDLLRGAVNPDKELDERDLLNDLFGAEDWPPEEYCSGFIDGVREFYAEVANKL